MFGDRGLWERERLAREVRFEVALGRVSHMGAIKQSTIRCGNVDL